MSDLFKRKSAIRIYSCPHDVVSCKKCRKRLHLSRRARRALRRERLDAEPRRLRNRKTGPHAGFGLWERLPK